MRSAILATVLAAGLAASASATNWDFTTQPPGTAATNQFPGLTFSLFGAVDNGPPVFDNAFGFPAWRGLLNSTTNDYPTATNLRIDFATPQFIARIRMNNLGGGNNGVVTGYDAASNVVGTVSMDYVDGFVFPGWAGVSRLNFYNGQVDNFAGDPYENSWLFTVQGVSTTVPEAATWAMLIAGFGLVGATMRRRRAVALAA